ncbi:Dolichyl-phosphate-mannose-protein mannosyltransferase [Micromonospora sediminicola]|uniref:Dolichyl-phosphate-mannose-protein mannosyltransferase n=1 Tax=Micromonospora sediminicola TaxID=946078 RepID=A0A1A9B6D0_9ACTN|nr:Dolichyl-phosphate-mannose-protein mannosyltransferase [Micromonospora sediminicola]
MAGVGGRVTLRDVSAFAEPAPSRARLGWPVWVVPGLLTLGITLVGIGHAQLWRDELATWSAATRPLPDLLRLTRVIDAATGPYYALMHGWTALVGTSPTALRLPSALAMAAAAALTARLGARLVGDRAGLLAGLLFAVLPATSRYGQEARPYALATLLAVLATLLLVDALRRPTWRRWAGYALAVAALALVHLIALTLLAAHAVVVLLTAARGPATVVDPPDRSRSEGLDAPWPSRTHPQRSTHPRDRARVERHGSHSAPETPTAFHPPSIPTGSGTPQVSPHPAHGTEAPGEPGAKPWDGAGAARDARGAPVSGRRVLARWLLALVPAVVLVTPLALVARGQRGRQLDWVDPARLSDLAALPGGLAQSGVVGGFLLALAALGAVRLGRRALLPATAVLLPVLLLLAAGTVVPLWVTRYLVFTVPFACLLAGAALAGTTPNGATPPGTTPTRATPAAATPTGATPAGTSPTRASPTRAAVNGTKPTGTAPAGAGLGAALALVALAGLLGLPDQAALRRTHEWPRGAPVDYAGAARVIAAGERPGDAIVYSPRDSWLFPDLGMAYHLGSRLPRDVLVVRDQRQGADLWATECDAPARCLAGVDRVWLVVTGRRADPLAAVPGAKGAALRDGFTVRQVWPRPGLTVALLAR